jgi:hypothetical protein
MGRFVSPSGVTFAVDDSKDDRYEGVQGYEPADKAPAKKAAASKSSK